MLSTTLSSLKKTGMVFRPQEEVSSAMIQTEWGGLGLDSVLSIISQVKMI